MISRVLMAILKALMLGAVFYFLFISIHYIYTNNRYYEDPLGVHKMGREMQHAYRPDRYDEEGGLKEPNHWIWKDNYDRLIPKCGRSPVCDHYGKIKLIFIVFLVVSGVFYWLVYPYQSPNKRLNLNKKFKFDEENSDGKSER